MHLFGLCNYYRRFIPRYTLIAKPLHSALIKEEPDEVMWSADRERAFIVLKEALSEDTVLMAPLHRWKKKLLCVLMH